MKEKLIPITKDDNPVEFEMLEKIRCMYMVGSKYYKGDGEPKSEADFLYLDQSCMGDCFIAESYLIKLGTIIKLCKEKGEIDADDKVLILIDVPSYFYDILCRYICSTRYNMVSSFFKNVQIVLPIKNEINTKWVDFYEPNLDMGSKPSGKMF